MDYNLYYMNTLQRLKLRCSQKFGSQRAFAAALGIDPGNLSKILTGVNKPTAILFLQICDMLDFRLNVKIDIDL